MDAREEADAYANLVGRFYSFYIRRPRLGRVVGPVLWGSDFGPLYDDLADLRWVPPGAVVLDAACGSGLSLWWLDPAVTYIGVDISPAMLGRAREVTRRRRFAAAELQLADVMSIPVAAGAADVALLYNALHCVPHPEAALDEVLRCLRPHGELRGSMLVRGAVPRVDRFLDTGGGHDGLMGPGGTAEELTRWLHRRLADVEVATSGAVAMFRGRRGNGGLVAPEAAGRIASAPGGATAQG